MEQKRKLKYISFGIEGQERVRYFSYDGDTINVSHTLNGDSVDEYICKNIMIENDNEINHYILSQCTGEFEGSRDIPIVSVNNDGKVHLD